MSEKEEEVAKKNGEEKVGIIISLFTCFSTSLSSSTSAFLLFSTSTSSAFAAATSGGRLECAPPERAPGFFFDEPIVDFFLSFYWPAERERRCAESRSEVEREREA